MQSAKFFVGVERPEVVTTTSALLPPRSQARARRDEYSPRFFAFFGALMDAFTRVWFRFRIRHVERIPNEPCLFVGNHSGIGVADVLCFVGAWWKHAGTSRRVVGMMAQSFVDAPVVGRICRAFGAVYANRKAARDTFERGDSVICFPGGDIDACRPVHEHRKVVFGDRRGYIRLALDSGVPIVPVATIGSHFTYLLAPGGYLAARLLRSRRWLRADRLPLVVGVGLAFVVDALAIAGVLPWWSMIIAAIAAIVPNPVRITTDVLPPIDVAALTAHIADPEERVEVAHAIVHGRLEAAVATLRH